MVAVLSIIAVAVVVVGLALIAKSARKGKIHRGDKVDVVNDESEPDAATKFMTSMAAGHAMDKVMHHIDERLKESRQRDEDFWLWQEKIRRESSAFDSEK